MGAGCYLVNNPKHMKTPTKKIHAFTLIELLVVVTIIGILITIAVPTVGSSITRTRLMESLANAKSLQVATQMMTLDNQQAGGPDGIEWTMKRSSDGKATPLPLADYFDALVRDGYLSQPELRKLLSAPGKTPTQGGYRADNIAFNIYEVEDASPVDQIIMTSANINPPGGGMDANATPFGSKGFMFIAKNGSGGIRTRSTDATSTTNFPTGPSDNGVAYRYAKLK
jgi:prepilin-type N-terminal cleavage/methylation domain-containing protein